MPEKTIAVCPHHEDHLVSMIFTFAFVGAEYWCPYCGHTCGMLEAERQPLTQELLDQHEKYLVAYRPYIEAKSTLAATYVEYPEGSGKMINPRYLPEEELARLRKIIEEGWKAEVWFE